MNDVIYHAKLNRALDRMGGLYGLEDILERIADGRMQSFVAGNSWLITEVNDFPHARTLDFIAAVGDLKDWRELHDEALGFADRLKVHLIRAIGRRGWIPQAEEAGWRLHTVNQVYQRDMSR